MSLEDNPGNDFSSNIRFHLNRASVTDVMPRAPFLDQILDSGYSVRDVPCPPMKAFMQQPHFRLRRVQGDDKELDII